MLVVTRVAGGRLRRADKRFDPGAKCVGAGNQLAARVLLLLLLLAVKLLQLMLLVLVRLREVVKAAVCTAVAVTVALRAIERSTAAKATSVVVWAKALV